jgi:glycosyltransferase involved in cell wall biosynthesis
MKNADCIVLPSYHEGMSNVLLEGAAMGLPLITTNIPGCKEAVEDGKSGFLCKEKNTESLVSVMERFIALSPEERREMGLRGRVKMINEFDRRIVVEQYIKVINETLGETS